MGQTLHALLRQVAWQIPEGLPDPVLQQITCDSRAVQDGTLFLGLPGERVDGGQFWRQALEAGAAAAVIGPAAAAVQPPAADERVVVVSEPVARQLGELAAAFWQQPSSRLALIGVTGTNGKTTTTYLIEHLATAIGTPTALFGT